MGSFFYFAYGSNMLNERLRLRCSSAQPIGPASASGFGLNFLKRGRDNSGKASILESFDTSAVVTGVVFSISMVDMEALDHAEGYGYTRTDQFHVRLVDDGTLIETTTYIAQASAIDVDLVPFDWYMALVVAGARQHRLPDDYIERLDRTEHIGDPQPLRETRLDALQVLERAGIPDYTQII